MLRKYLCLQRWRNFFQFIVLKGILLDPFVTQAIEYEISQAIQNVDGTVVVATVGGLQKGIESVEIAIGHLCQPNIFFLVLQTCIFMEVAAKTIILVGGQLRDSYADLFLSLLAIKHQLGQQHTNLLAGTFQPLFDFDGITLEPTAILGKAGIQGVESNLGTAIRTGVVLVMAWLMVLVTGKAGAVRQVPRRELAFICLSGVATGASWLCYYRALQSGPASVVVPIDKLSILRRTRGSLHSRPRRYTPSLRKRRRRYCRCCQERYPIK